MPDTGSSGDAAAPAANGELVPVQRLPPWWRRQRADGRQADSVATRCEFQMPPSAQEFGTAPLAVVSSTFTVLKHQVELLTPPSALSGLALRLAAG